MWFEVGITVILIIWIASIASMYWGNNIGNTMGVKLIPNIDIITEIIIVRNLILVFGSPLASLR